MCNIFLTGFMGTGKTVVGLELARRTGRRFVDMDADIEARAGKSISQIFAEDGEAKFRAMESELCQELAMCRNLVVATGGGTVVDPANRAVLGRHGLVVCLTCSVEEILRRLELDHGLKRPLLQHRQARSRVESLLSARREAYGSVPWSIDTTGLAPEDVASKIEQILSGRRLSVQYPGGCYHVCIGQGWLPSLGSVMRDEGIPRGTSAVVVCNAQVAECYAKTVEHSLVVAGYRAARCLVPDGESAKSLQVLAELYKGLLSHGLERDGTLVALGGGVTTDLAGFAAATFKRGIRLVVVPTSLLAILDASVGGKTGVNLAEGKNLVGAFKQPALVLIDPDVLATLSKREFRSGVAEHIKHALLGDAALFAELERQTALGGADQQFLDQDQIYRSILVKAKVVEADPFDQGGRAALNLGHTLGHALEQLSHYAMRHGEAVSCGMVAAARIAVKVGLAAESLSERVEAVLSFYGLPVSCPPYDLASLRGVLLHDKKRSSAGLGWVLPVKPGEVLVEQRVASEVVDAVLLEMGAQA